MRHLRNISEFVRINESKDRSIFEFVSTFTNKMDETLHFDQTFAEVESNGLTGLPDCWPTNVREWNAVKEQVDRLNDIKLRLYKGQVGWDEILKYFTGDKEWLRTNIKLNSSIAGVYNTAADTINAIVLNQHPYKHSLLEIAKDMRNETESEFGEILHIAGLDAKALVNALNLSRGILAEILKGEGGNKFSKVLAERKTWANQ